MGEPRCGLKVSLPVPSEAAIVRATEALKAEGFGVLTTIDAKQTLKAKLDRDFRKYVILGASAAADGPGIENGSGDLHCQLGGNL
jgi:uncharacterized protein (DUF302 family)